MKSNEIRTESQNMKGKQRKAQGDGIEQKDEEEVQGFGWGRLGAKGRQKHEHWHMLHLSHKNCEAKRGKDEKMRGGH